MSIIETVHAYLSEAAMRLEAARGSETPDEALDHALAAWTALDHAANAAARLRGPVAAWAGDSIEIARDRVRETIVRQEARG